MKKFIGDFGGLYIREREDLDLDICDIAGNTLAIACDLYSADLFIRRHWTKKQSYVFSSSVRRAPARDAGGRWRKSNLNASSCRVTGESH